MWRILVAVSDARLEGKPEDVLQWRSLQYEGKESDNDAMSSLEVHLPKPFCFIRVVYSCPLTLRRLLLLWLLRRLLDFGRAAPAGGDVGQRRKDLAVLHDGQKGLTNWRLADAKW